jgi:hypothetical protein
MGFFSSTEIEPEDVQRDWAQALLPGEHVLAAFRSVRDVAFLTNYRFALVDVQGLTGRKVDIMTIPYRSITRYSVETAGTFDMDADLRIWVSGDPDPIEVKVGRRSNVAQVQQILARAVLSPRG